MGSDPTLSHFWTAVNKGLADPSLTQVFFDPTWWDFFLSEKKKLKNFVIFGENFLDLEVAELTWPGSRFLTQTHHYLC